MLTDAWFPLRYHQQQAELWESRARFKIVVAGRGSGKTELARRYVTRWLPVRKPWPDPIYFYALPTYKQAKRVAWKPLKRLIHQAWIKRISESDLTIETVYGSTLHVLGLDKPHRAEGVQWDGGIVDESSDQRAGVFDTTLLPAFSHRRAWCWRIGVPKRYGVGAREFKLAFDRGLTREDPDLRSFTWPSRDILTAEALRFASDNLDPIDFSEQYEANWEQAGGAIFHGFDAQANVSREAVYRAELPIVVGSDFNVNPMCWILSHKIGNGDTATLDVFDELVIRNTNTEKTLELLAKRYGQHRAGWLFCGDATGRSRKTSASESDYVQIRNDDRFVDRRVSYPKSNPSVVNRFAACNALLKNAAGVRRCRINPKCKRLIDDLTDRAWKEGTREPDDYADMGHASDAFGYIVTRLFPIRVDVSGETPEIFGG